jgi:hypothetical protein
MFGMPSRVEGRYEDFPIDRDGVPMDSVLNKTPLSRASLLFHLASRSGILIFREKSDDINS